MPVDVGAGNSSVEPRDSRSLDVVHLTAELAPIAKVGGGVRWHVCACVGTQLRA
jgi:hypothetical protein